MLSHDPFNGVYSGICRAQTAGPVRPSQRCQDQHRRHQRRDRLDPSRHAGPGLARCTRTTGSGGSPTQRNWRSEPQKEEEGLVPEVRRRVAGLRGRAALEPRDTRAQPRWARSASRSISRLAGRDGHRLDGPGPGGAGDVAQRRLRELQRQKWLIRRRVGPDVLLPGPPRPRLECHAGDGSTGLSATPRASSNRLTTTSRAASAVSEQEIQAAPIAAQCTRPCARDRHSRIDERVMPRTLRKERSSRSKLSFTASIRLSPASDIGGEFTAGWRPRSAQGTSTG